MPVSELTVGPGNEGQAQAWDGDEGVIWSKNDGFFDSGYRHHQAALMRAAAVNAGEHVLDLGCGNGESTRAAARASRPGGAVGIDLSALMIDRARELAADEGLTNASFIQGDAQVYPFDPGAFDVAISRTGAMFFADQVAAFTNVARALTRGGRLAIVSWQGPDRNEWMSACADALTLGKGMMSPPPGAPSPFAHADPARTTQILTTAGFTNVEFEDLEVPIYLGADADEGFAILSEMLAWMMGDLEGADRTKALDNLRSTLTAHQTPEGVSYGSSAWLITARRA